MRLQELLESQDPSWFRNGKLLTNNDFDDLDAADFIEGDEWDYEWRLCIVPVSILPHLHQNDIDSMDAEEPGRMDNIRDWMRDGKPIFHMGKSRADTKDLPIVMTIANGQIKGLLDGWHRVTAAKELNMPSVYAVVGKEK